MKAQRWWKGMDAIMGTKIAGKRSGSFSFSTTRRTKRCNMKEMSGRDHKRAEWVEDLYTDLRYEFERLDLLVWSSINPSSSFITKRLCPMLQLSLTISIWDREMERKLWKIWQQGGLNLSWSLTRLCWDLYGENYRSTERENSLLRCPLHSILENSSALLKTVIAMKTTLRMPTRLILSSIWIIESH